MTKIIPISINTNYITLGQFLKLADLIHSGGYAKNFLLTASMFVNDIEDNRRGRKLYPGDQVRYKTQVFEIVAL